MKRNRRLRVWLEEWFTPRKLNTDEAKPENFCIGKENGKVACAFILQNSDFEYLENPSGEEAVYLHKLCVRQKFAHKEMMKSVVEAIRFEYKKKNIKYIRLDTVPDGKVVRKI